MSPLTKIKNFKVTVEFLIFNLIKKTCRVQENSAGLNYTLVKDSSTKTSIISSCIFIIVCFAALLNPYNANAQKASPHDSSYYTDYPGSLTTRIYFSQKYAPFIIPASGNKTDIQYTPNTQLNMGIGATYNNFSLNLSYGFGFLNNDDEKGKTKGLDIQLHLYPHKWAIDALGIFHKGNYLYPIGYATHNSASYYYRPDVKINLIGLAAYRVPNAEKFSYRAAMIQNE